MISADTILLALSLILPVVVAGIVWVRKDRQLHHAKVSQQQERIADLEQSATQAAERLEALQRENIAYREQISHLRATLDEQRKQSDEKLVMLNEAREQLNTEFKNLANEIFEKKQQTFRKESREQLTGLLDPLSHRIKDFEKRVEESYNREAKERFSLAKEVKNLQELNARISVDAVNLTNALKGQSKAQGSWGEVVLERLLEKSGLEKGREYEIQVSLTGEDGRRLQPDVIVRLPEGKDVVIDSKVSLTAYERYCTEQEEDARRQALKDHVQSLRGHVRDLGSKDYQKLSALRTLDFVLLFIPVEGAFALAVQEDGEIFSQAFDQNIVIVSPSTLLATLRTIQNIWRFEQQNRNAREIAEKAGGLYDKFVNFVKDLEEIGKRLGLVQKSWDSAHNKLVSGRGSLVNRAQMVKDLGARVSKNLDTQLLADKKDVEEPD